MKRMAIPLGIALISAAVLAVAPTTASAQRRGIGFSIGPRGLYVGPSYGYYGGGYYGGWYPGRWWGWYNYPYYGGYSSSYWPYTSYYSYPSYYSSPSYYSTTPSYSYYPPVQAASGTAQVRVLVPEPNAEVWFQGVRMAQTGTDRLFTTPALESGYTYDYQVMARWTQNGQVVSQTRDIRVQPGQSVVVDFNRTY